MKHCSSKAHETPLRPPRPDKHTAPAHQHRSPLARSFSGSFLLFALAACSTTDQARVTSTATTPLNDLNLVKAPIPEVLAAAQRGPYARPAETDCQALASEIKALDEVLGPDLDAPPSEAHRGLLERGTEATSGAAIGALQRTAEGVIPFRGWVRKLTGAERYSKRVAAGIPRTHHSPAGRMPEFHLTALPSRLDARLPWTALALIAGSASVEAVLPAACGAQPPRGTDTR